MSNLDDIFDLPEQSSNGQTVEIKEKKQRKKPELSDEKKAAMLERLKAGREKRQENLKAKKAPEEPKEDIVSKKEKEVVKKTDNKQSSEAERLSFINMMAGKAKPTQTTEKYERPKKKVQSNSNDILKEEPKKEEKDNKQNKVHEVAAKVPIIAPVVSITPAREPVVIRTFKKPIWG